MSTNRHNRPRGSAARRVAGARNRRAGDNAPTGASTAEHTAAGGSGPATEGSAEEQSAPGGSEAEGAQAPAGAEGPAAGAAAGDTAATSGSGSAEHDEGAAAAEGAAGEDSTPEDAAAEEAAEDGTGAAAAEAGPGAAAECTGAAQDGTDGAPGGDAGTGSARTLRSPSAKRRSVRAARRGTAGQHRAPEQEPAGADTAGEPARAGRLARVRSRPVPVLTVVTVLALAFAGWFGYETYALRYTGAAANAALTDGAGTSEAKGQITSAVEKVFSYDHNNVQASEKAADRLLTGSAVDTYEQLFGVVKKQAPKQQLVVTASVRESAVTRLEGDRAEVLVFVDQRSMRAGTGQSNSAPAQLSIGAHREGDTWKINNITLR
ncbi:hypothetical protein GCM10027174_20350 [Salinifilum aidingensis]